MNWKLFTKNESVKEPIEVSADFASKDKALAAAYDFHVNPGRHMKVLYIEGPNRERVEESEIEEWCREEFARREAGKQT